MSKHGKKRVLSLMLAVLLALLTACAESAADPETPAAETTGSAAEAQEAETEPETDSFVPDGLEDKDYEGRVYTVLYRDEDEHLREITAEELTGDVINDAVYERNDYLMGTYNIVFGEYKTNNTVRGDLVTDIKAGGGSYDAGFTGIMRCQTLGIDGYVYNMYDMPYINLEKPWWDHRLTEDCSLYGDVYLGTGDITVIDNDATWILMFNKKLHADYQLTAGITTRFTKC